MIEDEPMLADCPNAEVPDEVGDHDGMLQASAAQPGEGNEAGLVNLVAPAQQSFHHGWMDRAHREQRHDP